MKNNFKIFSTIAAGVALLSVSVLPVFAQSLGVSASASATVSTGGRTPGPGLSANSAAALRLSTDISTAQTRADAEITRRVNALNALSTRVNAMVNVSDSEKTGFATTIASQISLMNTLQAQIATDATAQSTSSLKTDIQSITKSYRIFALIIPQGAIAAASDRIQTIVGLMNALGVKLDTRITTAQNNGIDVTTMASAYADMQTKTASANTLAEAAVSETASLQPDNGVASVMASNTAALKDARTKIQTAQADLVTARKDIATIIKDLVALGASASASSTVTASTTP